jgi:riboflavin kinase / FMN adenylyltransferase
LSIRVWRSLREIVREFRGGLVTIGNFDGLHRGHRYIIEQVVGEARRRGAPSIVFTFEPHPVEVLRPEKPLLRLSTFADKCRLLDGCGVDGLVAVPFTRQFSALSARQFMDEVLVASLAPVKVVVGWNFRFGAGKEGDATTLVTLGRERAVEVQIIDPVELGQKVVSSSAIRSLLCAGEVSGAAELLGRYYSVAGPVAEGARRGRRLGIPTLNLLPGKMTVPRNGVYAVLVSLAGQTWPGVTNIGVRPTFGEDSGVVVESFLFGYSGEDAYGREQRVHFIAHLRDERKFDGPEALVAQIRRDVESAREKLEQPRPVPLWP